MRKNHKTYLNRRQLAELTGVRFDRVVSALAESRLVPDASDITGKPLFDFRRLAALEEILKTSEPKVVA